MTGHVVLLGDSIFDNASYVPGGISVIEHLRRKLPRDWRATLSAVDGATVSGVFSQLARIPEDATHLVLSVGGNDALWIGGSVLPLSASSIQEALGELSAAIAEFAADYRRLIDTLRELRLPLATCTIYDRIPRLGPAERAGLCIFNDVITRTAFSHSLPLLDLRLICNELDDYSAMSPIEPSTQGGGKIARAIVAAVSSGTTGSRVVT